MGSVTLHQRKKIIMFKPYLTTLGELRKLNPTACSTSDENYMQDLGLQCQTSKWLKVVVKAIWALFEPKKISWGTKEIFCTTFFLEQTCVRLKTYFMLLYIILSNQFLSPENVWSKQIWVKKNYGSKNFWPKKHLGKKN